MGSAVIGAGGKRNFILLVFALLVLGGNCQYNNGISGLTQDIETMRIPNSIKWLLTVTIIVLLMACEDAGQESAKANQAASTPIEIIEPWLRKMPPGISNTAGFMTIKNHTGKPLILEDVSLDWARMGMIHESKVVDGMATMEHQEQLVIEDSLEFKPGGLHIMIMGIKQPLVDGQDYNIFLHFAEREPLAVSFKLGQANQ